MKFHNDHDGAEMTSLTFDYLIMETILKLEVRIHI